MLPYQVLSLHQLLQLHDYRILVETFFFTLVYLVAIQLKKKTRGLEVASAKYVLLLSLEALTLRGLFQIVKLPQFESFPYQAIEMKNTGSLFEMELHILKFLKAQFDIHRENQMNRVEESKCKPQMFL